MSANQKKGVLVFGIGIVIVLASVCLPLGKGILDGENRIERNDFGEGEIAVHLTASGKEGMAEIEYSVAERIYSDEEVNQMLPEFTDALEVAVLGQNKSPDAVSEDMNFLAELEGYPFYVTWTTDSSSLIGSQGNIKESITEPVQVLLTAEIEYGDKLYEHSFPIVLVPKEMTSMEAWVKAVEESLNSAHEKSLQETYFTLPEEVDGNVVTWSEKKENMGLKLGLLCSAVGILFFFSDSIQRKEEVKKRLEEIRNEYPEFAIKCSMLIGAGMTMRQTMEKIARAYLNNRDKRKPLYEEVVIGLRELESGLPERQVYENFGRRCGIRETEKFGNLMSRNLRKGSEGLKSALQEEAEQAMEKHKEEIRKRGETAGTKLLFPMLILLLIVMVIIMIPAFSTFSI